MPYTIADWQNHWVTGVTPWNGGTGDNLIVKEFPRISAQYHVPPDARTLVPLCGSSRMVRFFYENGHTVTAVEWIEEAVSKLKEEQFPEFTFDRSVHGEQISYLADRIRILQQDFFLLKEPASYDFIYDRAALVALPRELRRRYSEVIVEALKPGALMFLRSSAFNFANLPGPPYSVEDGEVLMLYGSLRLLDRIDEKQTEILDQRFIDAGVKEMLHSHYLFQKAA